jgi:histidinol-phosphate phosphatase family protein
VTASVRPTQAVILAGGRGTRLLPLTETLPKPMIPFHGKPFLEYLVDLLREQGFERVLLLLGYRADVVHEYFGDGSRFGLDIQYSVTGADDLTVCRMRMAAHQLDPSFLLLYCDNYWPLQMDRLWERYVRADVPAVITVYGNRDGYTRDSVIVDDAGYVRLFDRTRTAAGLGGVEIGFALLERSVLGLMPTEDALFEEAVYPQLAATGQLAAHMTDHRYYSVGSIERLPLTEEFLRRRPTVILDRDGVLNHRPPRAQYVTTWADFEWLPDARDALRLLAEAGYRVLVVTNQAGVARGAMSEVALLEIHERMKAEAAEAGGRIDAVYYCPHDWDEGCSCRKPAPGMLFEAQRDFALDLTRTTFIGDDERDVEAAEAAGSPWMLVSEQLSLVDAVSQLVQAGEAVRNA